MTGSFYASIYARSPANGNRILLDTPGGRTITWTMAAEWSARYADSLYRLGLQKGDRIAVRVQKSPELLLLHLACLRAGVVFIPINPDHEGHTLDHILHDARPQVLIVEPEREDHCHALAQRFGIHHVLTLGTHHNGTFAIHGSKGSDQFPIVECHPDDPAVVLYSPDTKGRQSSSLLSHGNLLSVAQNLIQAWHITDQDIVLHTVPMFQAYGLSIGCHCALLAGASMIWLPSFNVDSVLASLPRCTIFTGTPSSYEQLLQKPGLGRVSTQNIRLFLSDTDPLPDRMFHDFETRTGHRILECSGITGSTHVTTAGNANRHEARTPHDNRLVPNS
ncbi:AMP-binding protein [Haematospirillum sp. H1815]|uniref:AMP-binding protein n=1 Tax=Haematospirillum sp. H1815 TaxID=2723108 RepID=UPI00143A35A7|nr:AMP-binding protein [Haematospirillum sp. H1815]NKD76188.1 AMP-binding protein [Haematospirillum sp. H1815]